MALILNSRPVSMAEVADIVKKVDDFESKPTSAYLKAFSKIKIADANEIAEKIRALKNVKIRESHIVKVLDFMPSDAEDIHKIFSDSSLSEDEVQSILQAVKKG